MARGPVKFEHAVGDFRKLDFEPREREFRDDVSVGSAGAEMPHPREGFEEHIEFKPLPLEKLPMGVDFPDYFHSPGVKLADFAENPTLPNQLRGQLFENFVANSPWELTAPQDLIRIMNNGFIKGLQADIEENYATKTPDARANAELLEQILEFHIISALGRNLSRELRQRAHDISHRETREIEDERDAESQARSAAESTRLQTHFLAGEAAEAERKAETDTFTAAHSPEALAVTAQVQDNNPLHEAPGFVSPGRELGEEAGPLSAYDIHNTSPDGTCWVRAVTTAAITEAGRHPDGLEAGREALRTKITEMVEALYRNRKEYVAELKRLLEDPDTAAEDRARIKAQLPVAQLANFNAMAEKINAAITDKLTGVEENDIALANTPEMDGQLAILLRHSVLLERFIDEGGEFDISDHIGESQFGDEADIATLALLFGLEDIGTYSAGGTFTRLSIDGLPVPVEAGQPLPTFIFNFSGEGGGGHYDLLTLQLGEEAPEFVPIGDRPMGLHAFDDSLFSTEGFDADELAELDGEPLALGGRKHALSFDFSRITSDTAEGGFYDLTAPGVPGRLTALMEEIQHIEQSNWSPDELGSSIHTIFESLKDLREAELAKIEAGEEEQRVVAILGQVLVYYEAMELAYNENAEEIGHFLHEHESGEADFGREEQLAISQRLMDHRAATTEVRLAAEELRAAEEEQERSAAEALHDERREEELHANRSETLEALLTAAEPDEEAFHNALFVGAARLLQQEIRERWPRDTTSGRFADIDEKTHADFKAHIENAYTDTENPIDTILLYLVDKAFTNGGGSHGIFEAAFALDKAGSLEKLKNLRHDAYNSVYSEAIFKAQGGMDRNNVFEELKFNTLLSRGAEILQREMLRLKHARGVNLHETTFADLQQRLIDKKVVSPKDPILPILEHMFNSMKPAEEAQGDGLEAPGPGRRLARAVRAWVGARAASAAEAVSAATWGVTQIAGLREMVEKGDPLDPRWVAKLRAELNKTTSLTTKLLPDFIYGGHDNWVREAKKARIEMTPLEFEGPSDRALKAALGRVSRSAPHRTQIEAAELTVRRALEEVLRLKRALTPLAVRVRESHFEVTVDEELKALQMVIDKVETEYGKHGYIGENNEAIARIWQRRGSPSARVKKELMSYRNKLGRERAALKKRGLPEAEQKARLQKRREALDKKLSAASREIITRDRENKEKTKRDIVEIRGQLEKLGNSQLIILKKNLSELKEKPVTTETAAAIKRAKEKIKAEEEKTLQRVQLQQELDRLRGELGADLGANLGHIRKLLKHNEMLEEIARRKIGFLSGVRVETTKEDIENARNFAMAKGKFDAKEEKRALRSIKYRKLETALNELLVRVRPMSDVADRIVKSELFPEAELQARINGMKEMEAETAELRRALAKRRAVGGAGGPEPRESVRIRALAKKRKQIFEGLVQRALSSPHVTEAAAGIEDHATKRYIPMGEEHRERLTEMPSLSFIKDAEVRRGLVEAIAITGAQGSRARAALRDYMRYDVDNPPRRNRDIDPAITGLFAEMAQLKLRLSTSDKEEAKSKSAQERAGSTVQDFFHTEVVLREHAQTLKDKIGAVEGQLRKLRQARDKLSLGSDLRKTYDEIIREIDEGKLQEWHAEHLELEQFSNLAKRQAYVYTMEHVTESRKSYGYNQKVLRERLELLKAEKAKLEAGEELDLRESEEREAYNEKQRVAGKNKHLSADLKNPDGSTVPLAIGRDSRALEEQIKREENLLAIYDKKVEMIEATYAQLLTGLHAQDFVATQRGGYPEDNYLEYFAREVQNLEVFKFFGHAAGGEDWGPHAALAKIRDYKSGEAKVLSFARTPLADLNSNFEFAKSGMTRGEAAANLAPLLGGDFVNPVYLAGILNPLSQEAADHPEVARDLFSAIVDVTADFATDDSALSTMFARGNIRSWANTAYGVDEAGAYDAKRSPSRAEVLALIAILKTVHQLKKISDGFEIMDEATGKYTEKAGQVLGGLAAATLVASGAGLPLGLTVGATAAGTGTAVRAVSSFLGGTALALGQLKAEHFMDESIVDGSSPVIISALTHMQQLAEGTAQSFNARLIESDVTTKWGLRSLFDYFRGNTKLKSMDLPFKNLLQERAQRGRYFEETRIQINNIINKLEEDPSKAAEVEEYRKILKDINAEETRRNVWSTTVGGIGFAGGAVLTTVGITALTAAAAATPVGWIVLGIIGVVGFGLIFTSALTKAGYDLAHSSMDVGSLFFQSRWISAYAFKLFRKREAQEKLSMTNERYTATIKEAQEALAELETEREGFKTGAALPRAGTVG